MNSDPRFTLYHGDCMTELLRIPRDSVDSVVTDPPYGWGFMGKAWDGEDIKARAVKTGNGKMRLSSDGVNRVNRVKPAETAGFYDTSITGNQAFQKFSEEWAREVFRVLKPGGHALIFCGPRTYHRMVCGIEDAGFEIRDCLMWLFGSGFPKSLDVSKAIDKANGHEKIRPPSHPNVSCRKKQTGPNGWVNAARPEYKTSAASAASAAWEGWGTALKPAYEPVLLARKPIGEKTVARNVLKYGTGALNIDASRVISGRRPQIQRRNDKSLDQNTYGSGINGSRYVGEATQGRFPSHLILDEDAAAMLDVQSGGASRFFYVAKTSKHERDFGLNGTSGTTDDGRKKSIDNPFLRGETLRKNRHPTVKPYRLMRYLTTLITPPGGVVLDPFMGSGTTGGVVVACGFRFIGIEKELESFETAKGRISSVKAEMPPISEGPKPLVKPKKQTITHAELTARG